MFYLRQQLHSRSMRQACDDRHGFCGGKCCHDCLCLHALRKTTLRVWIVRAHCLDATQVRPVTGFIPPSVPEAVAIAKSRMPRIGSCSRSSAVGNCPIGLPRFLATYSCRTAAACALCGSPGVECTSRTSSIGWVRMPSITSSASSLRRIRVFSWTQYPGKYFSVKRNLFSGIIKLDCAMARD